MKITSYQQKKIQARKTAIEWQLRFAEAAHSYAELSEDGARFERLGRRYGLLREFKENGIL